MKPDQSSVSALANAIFENFHGRRSAYAVRQAKTNSDGRQPYHTARSPDKRDLPLTPAAVEAHIRGDSTVGIYFIEPGHDSVRAAAFDLDDHDRVTPWQEMVATSARIIDELRQRSVAGIGFRSRGGRGIHIWLLFDGPVNAAALRHLMQDTLTAVGLREGAEGGLSNGVCEIFPKQPKVAHGGYGNLLALPLAGHSAPLDASGTEIQPNEWLAFFNALPANAAGQIPTSASGSRVKRPRGRPPKETVFDTHPLESCAFVAHCREQASNLSEPLWFALASNCGVVDGGEQLFHDISRLDAVRYSQDEAEEKFRRAEEASAPHCCETLSTAGFTCPKMGVDKKCTVHGGKSPAVFALDSKARIQFLIEQNNLKGEAKQKTISKIVLRDLRENGHFYRTQGDGRLLYFREHEKRLYDLELSEFKALCNDAYGINGATVLWKYCLDDIVTHCTRRGADTETFKFARFQNGCLYIDRGGQQVFRLNGEIVETVSNGTDGVLFEDSGMEAITPADNYDSSPVKRLLVDDLNIKETAYKELYLAYIYSIFFESLLPTKPILLMNGVKGSGKTFALRALKRALFGRNADVSTGFMKGEGDAIAAITHNYLLVVDNMDGMVSWVGNLVASVSTGTDIELRTLYLTNQMSTFKPRCFLAVTSRDPLSFKRDDLADRLFLIDLDRRKEFISESVLNERISRERGAIWAELLKNLNRLVARINTGGLPESSNHRLADWARLVGVIGEEFELHTVEEGLALLADARKEFVLQDNAIFDGIQAWVENDKWKDDDGNPRKITTGHLYEEVKSAYKHCKKSDGKIDYLSERKYPIETSRKFGVELKNTLPELASEFDIKMWEGRARQRYVSIRPKPVPTMAEQFSARARASGER